MKEAVEPTGPPKRKLEMAEYPDFMAKRFADFQPYRDATLQKWHDKTQLTMGKSSKVPLRPPPHTHTHLHQARTHVHMHQLHRA